MNGSWLLALTRTIPYLALTMVVLPFQALVMATHKPWANRVPRPYHRLCARILGFDVVVRGTPSAAHPTLFVSNHSSYFDIIILASLIDCSFIAKADMKTWPLVGWMAKLQQSVFVDRQRRNVGEHKNEVARRLSEGDSLVLFAEGTTSDGNRVLPFKTALFSVAEQGGCDRALTIQPVSIVATFLDGAPLGRTFRPLYAWYGDMELFSHAGNALSLGRMTVEVEFHEPFAAAGCSRKELAERCHKAVTSGVTRAVTGREMALPRPKAAAQDGESQVAVREDARIEAAA